jgi:hypothetical protein
MNAMTKFWRDVGLGYVTGLIGSFLAGVTAGLFPSAALGVIAEFSVDWYEHHWYFVFMSLLVALTQYHILNRAPNASSLRWSLVVCIALLACYAATVFPPGQPLVGSVHTHWRFVLFLLVTFQFMAIMIWTAAKWVRRISREDAVASESK